MLLKNIFLKTVRDYRRQVLIWGGGIGALMAIYGPAYNTVFGTGPGRAKAVEEYRKAIESFTILTGKISDIDTFGGFINSKIGSSVPIILGIWAFMAGSAIIRGEEERGSLDVLLSTPHSRTSVLLQKWAGLVVAMLGISLISWIGLMIGASAANAELSPVDGALAHLNWALVSLIIGGLALLFGQLTTRKAAMGWAGGIMAATYLLNNLTQTVESLQWTQYVYPFYYASLSQPLARSVGTNWIGIAVQVVLLVVIVGLALWMYQQRDHNGYFELFKNRRPAVSRGFQPQPEPKSSRLANTFGFGLGAALPGVLIWGLSISVYNVLIMSVFNEIKSSMVDFLNSSNFTQQLGFLSLTSNENILAVFIFLFLVLLVAAYAVAQVASWTSEENEGRLELILSTPQPRWRLLLTYFGVSLVSTALMIGLVGIVFGLCTWIFNIPVNAGNATLAFVGLWVISAIIEAFGYVLAAFGPGWAVGVTAGLVVLSYMDDVLKEVLKIPQWLLNISIFHQYGTPISTGLDWIPQLIMVALSIIFIVLAIFRFRQRDIAK